MARLDSTMLLKRISELTAVPFVPGDQAGIISAVSEQLLGAVTIAKAVYGDKSTHESKLLGMELAARNEKASLAHSYANTLRPQIVGTLQAIRGDVEAGLTGRVRDQATGEILGDFLGLAKEALSDGALGSANVAAVLTAAAFEDTIRRMGERFAGVTDRRELSKVIEALKQAGMLAGASLTTALGFLPYRNNALHADWPKLSPSATGSCLAFTEGLLLQHFS